MEIRIGITRIGVIFDDDDDDDIDNIFISQSVSDQVETFSTEYQNYAAEPNPIMRITKIRAQLDDS